MNPVYIFGNLARHVFQLESLHDTVEKLYYSHPDSRYLGVYSFLEPILMVRDPDLIKLITVKDFESFADHSVAVSPNVDRLWSKVLFSLKSGQGWDSTRATLSPVFSGSKLRNMFGFMQECSQQFVSFLKVERGPMTLEVKEAFARYATDVIGSTAFGITCNSLKEPNNEFYQMGYEITDFKGLKAFKFMAYSISSTLVTILRLRIISEKVTAFFTQLISDNLQERKVKQIVRPDMIDLLLQAQNRETKDLGKPNLTDEDITALAIGFFFAGYETISTFLTYLAYELALNYDVQNKLYQEIVQVQENGNERVTYDDIFQMKYLDNIVSECLRLHPPVNMLDRKCTKSYTITPGDSGGNALQIERNQVIWIPVGQIQRDPKFYPNPLKFDPERFSDDSKRSTLPSSVYAPFGIGPRNCIGSRFAVLECKILIVDLLRDFEFVRVDKTEVPLSYDPTNLSTLPKNGVWLGLVPRTH